MKNKHWTTADIPDLSGKVIIVTGGNSGLGYESVKAFANKDAEIILACRSAEKGEKAKQEILKNKPDANIVVMPLDLADLASVRDFANKFTANYSKLDILMNNAGIMTPPYFKTKDGFEGQFGTNHLGHFALTGLLFGLLKKTPESRIVNTSSAAHKAGKMDFSNLMYEDGKGYSRIRAYGRSKLANLLFTYELQRKLQDIDASIITLAAHPGGAKTNLDTHMRRIWWIKVLIPLISASMQSQAMGALPQIRAAVDPEANGGTYYGPEKGMKGYPVLVESNSRSHNLEDAARLWAVSEQLTGVSFEF